MSNGDSNGGDQFLEAIPESITRRVETVVKPGPAVFQTAKVTCHILSSGPLQTYVEELVDSLNIALKVQGSEMSFSHNEMMSYLVSLTVARVQRVNNQRADFTWSDRLVIPSFFSMILQHLGVARDHSLGLEITPGLTKEVIGKKLKKEDVIAFSKKLEGCGRLGFEYATQLPRAIKGDWEFMTMQFMVSEAVSNGGEATVMRHASDAHPVKALLASLVAIQGLKLVLTPLVEYGVSGLFETLVREFAHVRGS